MKLSKSKYCNAIQCKKLLWLDYYKPEEKQESNNNSVLDNGTSVGLVAKDLFGKHIDIEFNSNKNIMIQDTTNALAHDNVIITEASFEYNDNFCSIDILKKNKNDYEIVEVKSSTEINDIYIEDVSYQYYVMKSLGFNVIKVSIAYINNQYTRYGDLDINQLFNIEDVTNIVISNFEKVKSDIEDINIYMKQKELPNDDIGIHCFKPYDCPFFDFCTNDIPKDNVFKIRIMQMKQKMELYHNGIYTYSDLLKTNINSKFKPFILK